MPRPTKSSGMRCAIRRVASTDRSPQMHLTACHAACTAHSRSRAPVPASCALACFVHRRWQESVSPREDARAGSCLHPHPLKGLWRACKHNARSIMRNPLNAALRAALERGLFGYRPHNVRYVRCTRSERGRSLKGAAQAPQCSMPAHPLRSVRSRATVARCLPHRFAPCLVASLLALRV
jgi:hypothetical protein